MIRQALCLTVLVSTGAGVFAQTPQPFPRPQATPPAVATAPARQPPPARAAAPQSQVPATAAPAAPSPTSGAPTEATLGFPVYPSAQFIASYDAGQSQRYYIFGASTSYAELVAYYRTVLKDRGDEVFKEPPTHMFEVGRFRNETMAFPPGVTIKDWTWGGSAGYPNPQPGGQPARFASIIMIVPAPPSSTQDR